jgi:hypothetical protein
MPEIVFILILRDLLSGDVEVVETLMPEVFKALRYGSGLQFPFLGTVVFAGCLRAVMIAEELLVEVLGVCRLVVAHVNNQI